MILLKKYKNYALDDEDLEVDEVEDELDELVPDESIVKVEYPIYP